MASAIHRRPRQARTRETQTRILDAVLALIAEHGLRGVTFRAAAERSGIAVGNITYHFPTRAHLVQAAYGHHAELLRAAAFELPLDAVAELDTEARGEVVMAFLLHMATTDRLRYLAEFELTLASARDAELRTAFAPHDDATRRAAVELLRRVGSADPENDATIISALMEGLLLSWLARPDDAEHHRQIEGAVRRAVALLLPPA